MKNNSDRIIVVKQLGKIVKDHWLLRALNLLLQLEPTVHGNEEVISATSKLQDSQQVPDALSLIFC